MAKHNLQETIASIQAEIDLNPDAKSLLMSRNAMSALLEIATECERLSAENKELTAANRHLKTHRLRLNVQLMKRLRQQVKDIKMKTKNDAKETIHRLRYEKNMFRKQVGQLKKFAGIDTPEVTGLMVRAHRDIMKERIRQNAKWGTQRHPMELWYVILGEEVGEVGQAIQGTLGKGWGKPSDADNLYTELIQVAAVAQAAAEQLREEKKIAPTAKRPLKNTGSD